MTVDPIERLRESIFSVLNTHADIVALTGRSTHNVVPRSTSAFANTPVLTYFVVTAPEVAADGDTRRVTVQFTAAASDDPTVNALLHVVEEVLDIDAFADLA